ncbi:carboxymuconolactone decarboxylase family protein [Paraburkholderia caribensis]|uniref:carboxymuconolactone decarboxylase family protein n=1 Tax=Paraburkholderia caribensis TaxID=75105 RepID=UPI00071F73BB|nr:carboxymuconolactone decarboxylase family protein [Paraburkholderia caribensis]ALP67761.1 alkylhydroperoxidase [Paraburkholderia caribensis]AUT57495.1 carboxymuconolactone decarboxylase family protein [Paraburkholderia caribensis]
MNAPRLAWTTLAPVQYKSLYAVSQSLAESSLGSQLIELVHTRVSQINGCAYCLDMHARELRKGGESWQRLSVLSAWRETHFFTDREQTALAWAESLTCLPDGHADREVEYQALREHFNDGEIVELTWAVAAINAWNRMAIGMHQPVEAKPID